MQSIITLALKDLKLLWRDKAGLFWVLVFPILTALFFGSMFGGMSDDEQKNMTIGVIGSDSPLANQLYASLDSSSLIETRPMTLDSAKHLVQRGKLAGFVEVRTKAESAFQLFAESTVVVIGIDPTRKMERGLLEGLVNQSYFTVLQQSMTQPGQMRESIDKWKTDIDTSSQSDSSKKVASRWMTFLDGLDTLLANSPASVDSSGNTTGGGFGNLRVRVDEIADDRIGPRSGYDITFPQAIQWALIGTAAAFGIGIVVERTRGTWLRLRLTPLRRSQILAGKGLSCFLSCMMVSTFLMMLGIFIFRVQVSNFFLLGAAMVASAICFVGLMMFISVLGKTENAVAGVGWGIFMVSSMLGGGMIPLMFLPSWITPLSNLSPVKWSILALEGAIWRGFGWGEMLLPLSILCTIGAVGYAIGVVILSKSE
jgi:ABC-2 type transport system permease protein